MSKQIKLKSNKINPKDLHEERTLKKEKIDNYSLLVSIMKQAKFTKKENVSENYYTQYFNKYLNNNMKFSIKDFYGFNFYAFIFSIPFFMYQGLWVGLFSIFLLSLIVSDFIINYTPIYLYIIPIILIPNILCGFLANYFMIMKAEKRAKSSIKSKWCDNNLLKMIILTNKKNNSGKFLNLLLGVPYVLLLFYFILILSFSMVDTDLLIETFQNAYEYELQQNYLRNNNIE